MPAGFHIPFVAFFGRTLAEYLEMFAISLDELRDGTTLDCPSGLDRFVAEACAAGRDPMYRFDPEEPRARARENIDATLRVLDTRRDSMEFRDYDAFKRAKYDGLDRFLGDDALHRARHHAASPPRLPFADSAFDRGLAASFLFNYSHTSAGGLYDGREFDLPFHLDSLREIARIARHEIRAVPMGSFDPPPRPHEYRDAARELLEGLGWTTRLVRSQYQSGLKDFNDVLIAQR